MDVMSFSDSMSEHPWPTSEPETCIETESKKLPSSKFKGVVPQPNGRWGAQIYERHQRVWLGTFNGEEQAAIAYDVAAKRFRGGDTITNFTAGGGVNDEHEAFFLYTHSKAEIVDMLRKHTYINELQQSKLNDLCHGGKAGNGFLALSEDFGREHLFEKVATPSDIGKLNRMVIPKHQAERHLPLEVECASKGVSLNLVDINVEKVWRFRYCYWRSSQSYVLTKGWSSFVKEKKLKAGDIVSFWRSANGDGRLFIDARRPSLEESGEGDPIRLIRLFGVDIF